MNDPFVVGLKMALVGAALGLVFFGGLWITLKRLPLSRRPYLLTLSSVIARTAAVLWGIWYFAGGDPVAIVGGLAGFLAVQLLATYWGGLSGGMPNSQTTGRKESP